MKYTNKELTQFLQGLLFTKERIQRSVTTYNNVLQSRVVMLCNKDSRRDKRKPKTTENRNFTTMKMS